MYSPQPQAYRGRLGAASREALLRYGGLTLLLILSACAEPEVRVGGGLELEGFEGGEGSLEVGSSFLIRPTLGGASAWSSVSIDPAEGLALVEQLSDGTREYLVVGTGSIAFLNNSGDTLATIEGVCGDGDGAQVSVSTDINTPQSWSGTTTYTVDGVINIESRLTVFGCATVEFTSGSGFNVTPDGSLSVLGGARNRANFRASDGGDWIGIHGTVNDRDNASRVELRNLDLEDVGGAALVTTDQAAIGLNQTSSNWVRTTNSVIRSVSIDGCTAFGIALEGFRARGSPDSNDNDIRGCGAQPVSLDASSISVAPRGNYQANSETVTVPTAVKNALRVSGGVIPVFGQVVRDAGSPYHVVGSLEAIDQEFSVVDGASDLLNFYIGGYSFQISSGVTMRFEPTAGLFIGTEVFDGTSSTRFAIMGSQDKPVRMLPVSPAQDWIGLRIRAGAKLTESFRLDAAINKPVSTISGLVVERGGNDGDGCFFSMRPVAIDTVRFGPFLRGSLFRDCTGPGLNLRVTSSTPRLELLFSRDQYANCSCGNDAIINVEANDGSNGLENVFEGSVEACPGFSGACTQACNECTVGGAWP